MFARLGPWCHDNRWKVVIGWVVLLFVGNGVAGAVGEAYRQDFSLNGFESTDGFTLVEEEFDDGSGSPQTGPDRVPGRAGRHRPRGPGGDGGAVRRGRGDRRRHLGAEPLRAGRRVPDRAGGRRRRHHRLRHGQPARGHRLHAGVRDRRRDRGAGARARTGCASSWAATSSPSSSSRQSELFGLAFAIIILIVAFGSVLAMGLPVGTALAGIGLGGAAVIIASNLLEVPDFAPFIGVMIGLGVGIDYALLIVTRYREQLHAGHDIRESIGIAMDTAGRSVVFAGRDRRHLAVRHALHGHRVRRRPRRHRLAHGPVHRARIDHPAAGPARVRRPQHRAHEVARPDRRRASWRSRSSVSGSGSRRWPSVGALFAILTIVLGFFVPPCSARWSTGRRSRAARRPPTGGAGSSSTGRGPSPSAPPRSSSCWRSRSSACASGSPTRATSPRTPPPSRPTTSSSRASARAPPVPIYLVAAVDGAEQAGALAAVNDAVAADPSVVVGARTAAQRPRRPHRGAVDRHARLRAAGRGDRRARQPPARRHPPAGRGGHAAPTCSSPASSPPTSTCPSTWRSGCRSSSAPCSRCRSCS